MKRTLTLAVIILMAAPLFSQEKNFIDQNYIEITARAEKEVTPDEIYLNITIKEEDNRSKSLEKKERDMFKKLTDLGIDLEKDMQIQDISTLLQRYLLKKDAVLTSKSYTLKVTNTTMLVNVFKELESLGIPDVNITKTSLSNTEDVRRDVMLSAAMSARESAEKLAKALGRELGKVIFIQCYDNTPRMLKSNVMEMRSLSYAADESFKEPVLEFEKIRFDQSVFVRFSLE
ncbi:MAG: SIMPL domain-containing protein [Bacteroidales bacterium]|nr:SIMPL domain-containing protein [Bacteroidales bacterium]MDD2425265.1 SIMPL domain-containing protein [Bacteroidales bacterium]MDD3989260.1 SIMPL domain-containing protein [Bacteroidales bacterium]